MKKVQIIFFIFLYIIFAMGMTLATHFCGGTITSVQLLTMFPEKDPCGCEDTAIPDDCCKTEIKSVQLNDEQIAVRLVQPSSPQTDLILWADPSSAASYTSNIFQTIIPASSPPESPRSYILHCTLLI